MITSKEITNPYEAALKAILVIGFIPVSTVIEGGIALAMWRWFGVPLGLPSLTLIQVIGIALLARFMVSPSNPRDTEPSFRKLFVHAISRWIVAYSFAWVIHLML